MPRFFVAGQPENGLLTLHGENAHHAGRVLRLRSGESVTLCDGKGTDFDCTIESVEKDAVVCRVQSSHPAETEPKQRLTLFMALPKGDKMDFIVQKAVELGVREIVPYLSKNCVSRPDKTEKKVERWQKIALEAAKQCGRGYLPAVGAVIPFEQAAAQAAQSETALFFYEHEKQTGLRDALADGVGETVSLLIGPEGGFAPEEAALAVDAGLKSVSLGTRILRCETAPVAALAAVLYAGGNM
ncbi:16S rRNA (uracil(1498)-N(3))-methyltransferase [Agathobaculum sp. Marseille-P7918]|uniref:16S rRNA (uracil(1498)-N(3))-methyltransferase n=1 Tax=Agathobaculum sp. Marseille-P7918 TaxID=2479843 RepID=UPI000F63E304|nr:16S rRNA (uracil(1498)-N(3))-methyltransferase [Agathobaculum sp. Marseille-P7918]